MGNICRSPAAEGVFRALVDERGLTDQIEIDSAGTIDFHTGSPADMRMVVAARQRGYELTSRARQINRGDIAEFDLIVVADRENLAEVEQLAGGPRDHIRMLGSFLDDVTTNEDAADVPDPYYGGGDGFERVLDMIEAACPAILDHLQRPD